MRDTLAKTTLKEKADAFSRGARGTHEMLRKIEVQNMHRQLNLNASGNITDPAILAMLPRDVDIVLVTSLLAHAGFSVFLKMSIQQSRTCSTLFSCAAIFINSTSESEGFVANVVDLFLEFAYGRSDRVATLEIRTLTRKALSYLFKRSCNDGGVFSAGEDGVAFAGSQVKSGFDELTLGKLVAFIGSSIAELRELVVKAPCTKCASANAANSFARRLQHRLGIVDLGTGGAMAAVAPSDQQQQHLDMIDHAAPVHLIGFAQLTRCVNSACGCHRGGRSSAPGVPSAAGIGGDGGNAVKRDMCDDNGKKSSKAGRSTKRARTGKY